MKLVAIVAAVVIAVAAVGATYWIAQPSASAVTATAANSSEEAAEPTPSKTGPHPKAVIPETEYDFGVMKMGETDKHTFIVRNEGEAPLKLGKPQTTCQCTVSEAAKNAIPPGGEGTVTLEWTPAGVADVFDKGAVLRTNDPKMPEIRLSVKGRVDALVVAEPQGSWYAGEVTGDQPIRVTGYVFSRLKDDLKIEAAESANPLLTATVEPMTEEQLKEREAKSGFSITALLAPTIPVGRFEEALTIRTNSEDEEFRKISTQVRGTRHGPIQILPTPGVKWNPEALAIDLERFKAAEGKSATVSLFVADLPEGEELRLEKVDASVPYVELNLTRDTEFKGTNRQRYELTFYVKPAAPATHRGRDSVKVTATTNHPEAETMKFVVQFISSP